MTIRTALLTLAVVAGAAGAAQAQTAEPWSPPRAGDWIVTGLSLIHISEPTRPY